MPQKRLTKAQAVELFGTAANLARAVGISQPAVSRWPDKLSERDSLAVRGAYYEMVRARDARAAEILS